MRTLQLSDDFVTTSDGSRINLDDPYAYDVNQVPVFMSGSGVIIYSTGSPVNGKVTRDGQTMNVSNGKLVSYTSNPATSGGNIIGKDRNGNALYASTTGTTVDASGRAFTGLVILNNGRQVIMENGKYQRDPSSSELIGEQKSGIESGVIRKETPRTISKDCPCEVKEVPYNLYLSRQQTAGSVPIRATQRKVVCQTPPQQSPDVPCDELERALQTMNGSSSSLDGITSSVVDTVKLRPIGSAIELGAAIAAGVYADRKFSTPTWATVGIAVVAGMIAGKITDSVGV